LRHQDQTLCGVWGIEGETPLKQTKVSGDGFVIWRSHDHPLGVKKRNPVADPRIQVGEGAIGDKILPDSTDGNIPRWRRETRAKISPRCRKKTGFEKMKTHSGRKFDSYEKTA